MDTPEDRYVRIGQINTRYWLQGEGKTPLLLVHGLGGFIENWQPCLPLLAERHRVCAVDLPGHGRSDKPLSASYAATELAAFVEQFATTLKLDRLNLVGHSLGGAVALNFALNYPDRVEKLALVESAGLGKEGAFALRLLSVPLVGELLSRPSRAGTEKMLKTFVYDQAVVTDDLVELHYGMGTLPGAQQTFLKTLRAAANLWGQKQTMVGPIIQRLSAIQRPTLVVWGRQDPVLPVAHAEVAGTGIPNARVEILEQCGHALMLEQTEAFTGLLLDFLSD